MQRVMTLEDINKQGMRVRRVRPDHTPVEVKEVPPDRNDVAEALALVAQAIEKMNNAKPQMIVQNNDSIMTMFTKLVKQQNELLEIVRASMAPEIVEAMPEEEPEEWDFDVTYDNYDRIKSVKARKCI